MKKTTESESTLCGLCEWCGKPLKGSVIMKISDDDICPACYWEYRRDQYRVKTLWKGVKTNG